MVRARWLLVAMALAVLVPWDGAEAVRVERRRPIGIVREPQATTMSPRERETAGGGRVDLQLHRTRRMLDLVRHRAERCGSREALAAVGRAAELQDRAETAARSGRRLGALQLTREARERGVAALRHCGHADRAPEGVVSALGRTEELLEVERERLGAAPSAPPGERAGALERAAEAQRRARDEFRDGRFESSLRLTQEARRALRVAPRDEAARPGPALRGTERAVPRDEATRPGPALRGTGRDAPRREGPSREAPSPPASRARPRGA